MSSAFGAKRTTQNAKLIHILPNLRLFSYDILRYMKTIVCIFAHPDDEAFGPAGTIAKLAWHNDVYILCATRGEAGKKASLSEKNLAVLREEELKKSAKILGVKNVYFLDFADGTLCNNLYHELAKKIQDKLEVLKPDTLITFEPRGISGHIDHITVSMTTSFVFKRLKFVKKLFYYCLSRNITKKFGNYFIYFPPGYRKSEIDLVNDVSKQWHLKIKAMQAHQTQIQDVSRILKIINKFPKEEYFLVLKK